MDLKLCQIKLLEQCSCSVRESKPQKLRDQGTTVKARNKAPGGSVSKHPNTGRYFGPGCYLGPGSYIGLMDDFFFRGISTVCFTPKNMCTCMHAVQDVQPCEYTQPPRAFTSTWATQIKLVDMLYLGAYTEGRRYFGRALLKAFTVVE